MTSKDFRVEMPEDIVEESKKEAHLSEVSFAQTEAEDVYQDIQDDIEKKTEEIQQILELYDGLPDEV